MVAAVCNEGGLGSLPVGGLTPEATLQVIRKTKTLTDKPFAVNLFVQDTPQYRDDDLSLPKKFSYRKGCEKAV
jgi:nitronate monooxygenase